MFAQGKKVIEFFICMSGSIGFDYRWNSLFIMIERIVRLRYAVETVLKHPQNRDQHASK